jgi:hypothetical protein
MATPTIIIGIGTSGLYTLENVQRFYYETYKTNKPKNVEYIYLETNEDKRPVGTPIGNDITRVYISLDDMATMCNELKTSCANPDWLPDEGLVLTAGLGAGGIRSCGRLALWGRNRKGDNFKNVIDAITHAYSKVMHINNKSTNTTDKPTVFVTGSLTGGTGAGIFIDMGYLIRHIIDGIKDIYGLFLLPPKPTVVRGYEVMYGNSYGSIKDLEFFNKPENEYAAKWSNGSDINKSNIGANPPYELVQFISQDYQDGSPAISNLGGLYKMAGLYLFLNIAGIYEKRRERLVDASGNSLIGKYGTFGLSAIQYPKDQIQDFVASQLSIDLLKRLTDNANYYLNGQRYPINRATINEQMDKAFGTILEDAFKTLNTVGGEDLLRSIDRDATKINKGEISGKPVDFIISMFQGTSQSNYHAKVNQNITAAQNVFIDSIYQQVDKALQDTENLYYARAVLEDLVGSINKTLTYWQSIGVSSQAQKWDNELRKLAVGCTKNTYKMVLEQDNVVKDRLATIFELMKMHLSVRILVDICKHIKEGDIKLEGSTHELPKLKFFDDLIKKLNALIGKIDDTDSGKFSFSRHIKDIEGDINDTTLPILRVYPTNSFEKECSNAKAIYEQKSSSKIRSVKEVIKEQNLFDYFKKNQRITKSNEEMYLDFIKAFRLKVDEYGCIVDFNISKYIRNHTDDSILTAKKSVSPFLKVDRIFNASPYYPRFVVGDDVNELTDLLLAFQNANYNDFTDSKDGKVELPDVKNIVVFYDEKGNYVPINDLSYIKQMQDCYENVPGSLADPNETNETWKKKRSAYTTK